LRALIAMLVVALVAGGVVAAVWFWPGALSAIGPTTPPSGRATPSGAEPSTPSTGTPSDSVTPSPSGSTTATRSEQAVQALESCRERVQAADEVLSQARTGITHWEGHVDAQRQWENGNITRDERQAQFKATRLKGPADQQRYSDALRAYGALRDASCGKAKGADTEIAAALAKCSQRSKAQTPVMAAAAGAMGDWKQHLADMQRAADTHVANAQEVWLALYRKAPTNINAYEKALRNFDSPRC
jgi:hypothetical protein